MLRWNGQLRVAAAFPESCMGMSTWDLGESVIPVMAGKEGGRNFDEIFVGEI